MLSPDKLKQNAVTSIRLGVEDFQRANLAAADGGDPERALSAARNLFAGILLLFKYGLASRVTEAEDVKAMLLNPPRQIVPHPDGAGGVKWKPIGKFAKQTIDVDGIEARFKAFGIVVDWDAMHKLRDERNHLEHLHPTQTTGAIAGFVAEMFPILQQFVMNELKEVPADFLGPSWKIMLEHQAFFETRLQLCIKAWQSSSVPNGVRSYMKSIRCGECGSQLVEPCEDDEDDYVCVACGERDSMMDQLVDLIVDEKGDYDPYDGDAPPLCDCLECDKPLFVISEGACRWCEYVLEYSECLICGIALNVDDQHNGGFCSYDADKMSKDY